MNWIEQAIDGLKRTDVETIAYLPDTTISPLVEPVDPDSRPPFDFAHVKRRVRNALSE